MALAGGRDCLNFNTKSGDLVIRLTGIISQTNTMFKDYGYQLVAKYTGQGTKVGYKWEALKDLDEEKNN